VITLKASANASRGFSDLAAAFVGDNEHDERFAFRFR
jgi:hypothetical protein